MPKPIFDLSFWRERLERAKKYGALHFSVGVFEREAWKGIETHHLALIGKYIKPEESVLDVGCGYGRFAEHFPPERYAGVDFVPEFIELAREAYPKHRFLVADLRTAPLLPEADWAICVSMRQMIVGNAGPEAWKEIERNLLTHVRSILVLEYSDPSDHAVITRVQ